MHIEIRDRNPAFIEQCRAFSPEVPASVGSIDDVCCDAVVSPANSFGFMDGGVDYAYSKRFGWHVMETLRAELQGRPHGELLVGEALIVPTGHADVAWVISAPTMRVPARIDAGNVFLATRAAVYAAKAQGLGHIIFPGMGTGCGCVPFDQAAKAMAAGIAAVFAPKPAPATWQEAQARHFGLEG